MYNDYVILYFMPVGSIVNNVMSGGSSGGKRIEISDITSIQFKEPATTKIGFIQFSYAGSIENKGGVFDAAKDENSIVFQPNQQPLAREIVNFIEQRRKELKTSSQQTTVIQQTSAAANFSVASCICRRSVLI